MAKMKRRIPDLRAEHTDITFEHCHILLVRLGEAFALMEGDDSFRILADEIDPSMLLKFYKTTFEIEPFNRLFQCEIGKGVLIGAFVQELQKGRVSLDSADS